jgi:formylglycine-generating enzyme required for sulfatase activity
VTLTLMRIPAGSFWMGAPEEEKGSVTWERPVHRVRVGEFLLGQTPVTQAQWRAVAAWEPKEGEKPWALPLDPDPVGRLSRADQLLGDERPVVNVSWEEAQEFCRRLRQRQGKNFTLPSEAEWEYACRAGTTTPFHFGATLSTDLANYDGNYVYGDGVKGIYRNHTTDVASFPANAWGLHDMHGNVWEWCADDWHGSYEGAPEDGRAWLDESLTKDVDSPESTSQAEGSRRNEITRRNDLRGRPRRIKLLRGGSWVHDPGFCRSAFRNNFSPDNRSGSVGFRVCCLPQDVILYT